MSDPVSWLMIQPGWKVYASDGGEVGQVDEVAGDDNHDIFDGLAIATSAFGKPRYVPSEQVAQITEGAVQLSLTSEQVKGLREYLEPATSLDVEADNRPGGIGDELREIEGDALAPIQTREHSMNVFRRLWFFLRRSAR